MGKKCDIRYFAESTKVLTNFKKCNKNTLKCRIKFNRVNNSGIHKDKSLV